MVARSWITNLRDGETRPYQPRFGISGIAMGGDQGVARVEVSIDGGARWYEARLGPDEGRYSFRRFSALLPLRGRGALTVMSRCTNSAGEAQPMEPNWNPSGYMRSCVEAVRVEIA
jgi:hypothetical protein